MPYKIQIKGNYFYLTIDNSTIYKRSKSKIEIVNSSTNDETYDIIYDGNDVYVDDIKWTEFTDENDSAFSSQLLFDDWINNNTGNSNGGGNGNGVVSVTGYNVDNSDTKNPVIEDNYEVRNDDFTTNISNVWHDFSLPNQPNNRTVVIIVEVTNRNVTVGINSAGETLDRTVRLDRDSVASFTVKTSSLGEVSLFTSDSSRTFFKIESYLN